jgi:hypothetical protein
MSFFNHVSYDVAETRLLAEAVQDVDLIVLLFFLFI